VKKNVENKNNKGFASDSDCGKPCGDGMRRLRRETDATKLAVEQPLWFRLLLKIPELPSIVYMPDIAGLFCYFLLPAFIIGGYILAFLYIVFTVPFPWAYLCMAGIIAPLLIISLSAKAHAFWNYYKLVFGKARIWDIDKAVEDYVALIRKKS
jgi:hypothetical protein